MLAAIVAVSLAVSPAFAAEEKELSEAAQKELKQFQGKWKAVKVIEDGREQEPKMGDQDVFIEFKDRKFHLGDKEVFSVSALDPSTTPKCLDFTSVVDMGELTKGKVYEGIYKLDGDTLTLALYIGEGQKRPDKFESEKDSKIVVVTFEREKK